MQGSPGPGQGGAGGGHQLPGGQTGPMEGAREGGVQRATGVRRLVRGDSF